MDRIADRTKHPPSLENISYIRQMLAELRSVADAENCDMLCYLIEMAYLEAGELQRSLKSLNESGS